MLHLDLHRATQAVLEGQARCRLRGHRELDAHPTIMDLTGHPAHRRRQTPILRPGEAVEAQAGQLPSVHPSRGPRGEKLRHDRETAGRYNSAELVSGLDERADLQGGHFPEPPGYWRTDVAPLQLVGQSVQRGCDGGALPFELGDLPFQPFELRLAVT